MDDKRVGERRNAHHELEIGIMLVAIIMIVLVTLGGRYDLSFLF